MDGAYTWRRPTFTRPIVSLSSAQRRFTSGFGMGPGGSTALWSPEGNPVPSGLGLWGPELCLFISAFQVFSFSAFTCRPLSDIHMEVFPIQFTVTDFHRSWFLVHSDSKNRNQAERMISTSRLNTLLHFHLKPINVVVSDDPSGKIHLGSGLALRCFQRLSIPHLATRPCS